MDPNTLLLAELQRTQAELKGTTFELGQTRLELEHTHDVLDNFYHCHDQMLAQNAALQAQLRAKDAAVDGFEQQLQQLQCQNAGLLSQLEEARAEAQRAQQGKKLAHDEMEVVRADLKWASFLLQEAEEERKQAQAQHHANAAAANDALRAAQQQLQQLERLNSDLKLQVRVCTSAANSARQGMEQQQAQTAGLQAQLAASIADVHSMRLASWATGQQLQQLRVELEECTAASHHAEYAHAQQLEHLRAQSAWLKSDLTDCIAVSQSLATLLLAKVAELAAARQSIAEASQLMTNLMADQAQELEQQQRSLKLKFYGILFLVLGDSRGIEFCACLGMSAGTVHSEVQMMLDNLGGSHPAIKATDKSRALLLEDLRGHLAMSKLTEVPLA